MILAFIIIDIKEEDRERKGERKRRKEWKKGEKKRRKRKTQIDGTKH